MPASNERRRSGQHSTAGVKGTAASMVSATSARVRPTFSSPSARSERVGPSKYGSRNASGVLGRIVARRQNSAWLSALVMCRAKAVASSGSRDWLVTPTGITAMWARPSVPVIAGRTSVSSYTVRAVSRMRPRKLTPVTRAATRSS
jgi:hypothetical protein